MSDATYRTKHGANMAKDPMMIPAAAEAYVARLSGDAATYAEDAIEMLKSAKKTGISTAELRFNLSKIWPDFDGTSVISKIVSEFCTQLSTGRVAWLGPLGNDTPERYVPPEFYDSINSSFERMAAAERAYARGLNDHQVIDELVQSGIDFNTAIATVAVYKHAFKSPTLNGQPYVPSEPKDGGEQK